jgi:hypothetical protein
MVPPSSDRISRVPPYLLCILVPHHTFRIRGYHPLWQHFPELFARYDAKYARLVPFRSPLLWESRLISIPAGTEMFQFSAFALSVLCIQTEVTLTSRVSPFGHHRIKACLRAPRCFSHATTSFIACDRQGIHYMHLVA